jgi:hypothetical protein
MVAPTGSGLALRIATDARYPGTNGECRAAILAVRGRKPYVQRHKEARFVTIVSYWNAWPCLIPQHGPGRKHSRAIALEDWQQEIVNAYPRPFLRGLIHSDGWRGLNRGRVKGKGYAYPLPPARSSAAMLDGSASASAGGLPGPPWYTTSVCPRAADIAVAVAFTVAAPPRMNVAELIVLATVQG